MDDNDDIHDTSSDPGHERSQTQSRALLLNPALRRRDDVTPTTTSEASPDSIPLGLRLPRAPQSLRYLAETAEWIRSSSALNYHQELDDGRFFENTDATMQAIADRTRSLERRYQELRASVTDTLGEQDAAAPLTEAGQNTAGPPTTQLAQSDTTRGTNNLQTESAPASGNTTNTSRQVAALNRALRSRFSQDISLDRSRRRQGTASSEARSPEGRGQPAGSRGVHGVSPGESNTATTESDVPLPNPASPLSSASNNPDSIVERSTSARRDLERALRDYRLARRALRNHYNNEPASPSENNRLPAVTDLLQSGDHNNDRPHAGGSSPTGTPSRPDLMGGSTTATTGVRDEASRDGDNELAARSGGTLRPTPSTEGGSQRPRAAVSTAVGFNSHPYLAPTTTGNANGVTSGGMREHYHRLQERSNLRGLQPARPGQLNSSLLDETTVNRRRFEIDRHSRLNETIDRFSDTLTRLQGKNYRASNPQKTKVRNTLKYLTLLKDLSNDGDQSLDAAKSMGLDSLAESLAKEVDIDLPLRIDELPTPKYSSWLDDGMSWSGMQKVYHPKRETRAGPAFISGITSGPLFEAGESVEERVLRAFRHRERLRAERGDRAINDSGSGSFWRSRGQNSNLLRALSNRAETLADVERHLSDLLEEEERRLTREGGDVWRPFGAVPTTRSSTRPTTDEREQSEDKWPVNVTIHEVNWKDMKVYGTMVANQIPHHTPPAVTAAESSTSSTPEKITSGMETFFDGEIIDFRTHELETSLDKIGYNAGGLDTDIRHWSLIGPFRQEINKAVEIYADKKVAEAHSQPSTTENGSDNAASTEQNKPVTNKDDILDNLDPADLEVVINETMSACLGSKKWLERTMGEGGWILMRWKERCFVAPPVTTSISTTSDGQTQIHTITPQASSLNSNANNNSSQHQRPDLSSRQYQPQTLPYESYTTAYSFSSSTYAPPGSSTPCRESWGLTIRGFYYVALHRTTGNIEAFYYDSGSQPYQQLTMKPAGLGHEEKHETHDGANENEAAGVRREFGIIELR